MAEARDVRLYEDQVTSTSDEESTSAAAVSVCAYSLKGIIHSFGFSACMTGDVSQYQFRVFLTIRHIFMLVQIVKVLLLAPTPSNSWDVFFSSAISHLFLM
jgi:hypothetical protein